MLLSHALTGPYLHTVGTNAQPARTTADPAGATRTKSRPPSDAVLESLIAETHHIAARTLVIASWINALSDNPDAATLAPTLRVLIPADPVVILTMRRWIASTSIDTATLAQTNEFFATFSAARNAFNQFDTESQAIGAARAGILHATVLKAAWRLAAERADETLHAQAPLIAGALPPIYTDNTHALRQLLAQVTAGHTPCLNTDGTIRLPDLPNQRANIRRALLENCLVKAGKRNFKAFARDVSQGGLGLDRVPHLIQGRHVTITLPTGRTITGQVRWYKNATAGIAFFKPLPPNDPLLSA